MVSLTFVSRRREMTRLVVVLTMAVIPTGTAAGRPLVNQGGAARGSVQGRPPGWSDTLGKTLDLTIAGKHGDVVAIYEQWVAKYPNFADAHGMLGGAYESLGMDALTSRASDAALTALKYFETAATHLRRAFDLGGGETPSIAIRSLVDIYGPYRLRLPEQQAAVVREALEKYTAEPRAHGEYIKLLMVKGEKPEAVDSAVRAARTAVPKAAEPRIELAALLHQIGEEFQGAASAPAMIGEAVSVLDEVLKANPSNFRALDEKADALRAQAKLTTDPAGARLLLAEADRASQQAKAIRNRRPNDGD
jgi:tetratricopeptide (TPR) repeat protein